MKTSEMPMAHEAEPTGNTVRAASLPDWIFLLDSKPLA
jgi:hypothetical protein